MHPESISQLFGRHLARTDIPRIRFHDLRHTHASLLVAAGTSIKVVSERLGHAHPGFTMATYQHLRPGMSATAALDFANMIATAPHDDRPGRRLPGHPAKHQVTARGDEPVDEPVDDLTGETRNARKPTVSGHFIWWRG